MSKNGMSIKTLLLLGGAAALVLSPDLRRRALVAANDALDGAQSLLDETIMPAAQDVAVRASDLTEEARKRALMAQDDLHEYLAETQKEVERRRRMLLDDADDTRQDLSKKAERLQKEARKSWLGFRSDTEDYVDDTRKTLGKKAAQAQKEARKGLLSFQSDAQDAGSKLDKRTRKQIAGYQKDIARLQAEVERHSARNLHLAAMQGKKSGTGLGGLLPLALLAGAGVVIMVPSIRKSVEDLLEGVSPEAAGYLRKAGEVAGTFWIEDMPAPKPAAPAPAPKPATTVSTPAAADAGANKDASKDVSKDAPKTDAGKVDTSKVDTSKSATPADDKKPEDKK